MICRRLIPLLLLPVVALAADFAHFGKAFTVKEETKISEILGSPEKFVGRKVKVRGIVVNVCPERGCFLNIKGDKKFQELQGKEAVAEGTISLKVLSVQEQKDMCPVEAKALDRKFDPAKIKGPMKVVRLEGLGAAIAK